MEHLGILAAFTGSYLVGSVPTAYLVVKRLKRVDVRTIGSGNVGATNVTRVAGLWAGISVFLVDLAKGLVAVQVLGPWLIHPLTPTLQFSCGLAAILGHAFPVFLNFRGGKGVATTIGVLIGTMPIIAGTYLLVWGLVRSPAVSLLGFGLGFSLVLVSIVGGFASHVRRMMPARSHGR